MNNSWELTKVRRGNSSQQVLFVKPSESVALHPVSQSEAVLGALPG